MTKEEMSLPTAPIDLSFNVLGKGDWKFAQSASSSYYSGLSSNGQYQVVAADYTWISSNYGANWTQSTGPSPSSGVAISASGQFITGINAATGYLFTSSDYGSNWTQREGSYNFRAVSMSANGQYQTCVADQSNVWWSDNYGSNWTVVNTAAVSFWDTAVSGNGQYQVAVSVYQYVYFSSNYGQTWVPKINDTARNWYGCALSETGDYITVASGDGGDIWTSTDYGSTFTQQTSLNTFFGSVTMSGDGKNQLSFTNNPTQGIVYISSNYGSNWATWGPSVTGGSFNLYDITISRDSKYIVGAAYFNGIYTYTTNNLFWTATSVGDTSYSVYYYTGGTHTFVINVPSTSVRYTDLVNNSYYPYAVKASNDTGMSDYSALSLPISIGNGGAAPGPPTNLIANGTTLSWTAPVAGADYYNLYTYISSVHNIYRTPITETSIAYSNLFPASNIIYTLTAQRTNGTPSIYSDFSDPITVSFASVPDNSVPGDTYTQTALQNVTSPSSFAATLQENAAKFESPIIASGVVDISGIMNSNALAPGYTLNDFVASDTVMIAISSGTTLSVPSSSLPDSNGVLYLPASTSNSYTLTINGTSYNFSFPAGTSFVLNGKTIPLGTIFTLGAKRYIYVGQGSAFFLGNGPVTAPSPPTISIRPRALDQQLNFFWGLPTNDGGGEVTSYTLYNSLASYSNTFNVSITDTGVTGLTNGTDYTFNIFSTNVAGNSHPATYRTVMPGLVPSVPQNVATTYTSGDSSAVITWDAPSSDGGATIKWYAIFAYSSNPADPIIKRGALGTDRQRFISGLNPAYSYTFTIYAVNDPGYSPGVTI